MLRSTVIFALLAAGVVAGGAASSTADYSAYVTAPPKVQIAGETYTVKVQMTNKGATVKPFCLDFTDDNDSWLIEMPGLYAFKSDTWCVGTMKRGQSKTVRARVIAAKEGSHKMSITLGKATIFRDQRKAIIDDDNALYWESRFVIVG